MKTSNSAIKEYANYKKRERNMRHVRLEQSFDLYMFISCPTIETSIVTLAKIGICLCLKLDEQMGKSVDLFCREYFL